MVITNNGQARKCKIRFDDGRKGTQTEWLQDDGTWKLTEIVVTQDPNGKRCQYVYGPRSYLNAGVFSFSDLGGKWSIEEAPVEKAQ
jgi:hypothetical protein